MTGDRKIYDLTRRKVLGGLTAVGIASAAAGVGTSAFFSDQEIFGDNRLVAGELDLLVDFEEHYSNWSADEAQAVSDVRMATEGTLSHADYPPDYTGLPVANDAMIAVPTDELDAFMDATAVDAFPDTDRNGTADDGIQDDIPEDDECGYLRQEGFFRAGEEQDVDGQWVSALDSLARTEAHRGDPLVALSDVKPGDFGEVTFSLHLCDNPGFIWMTGELISNDEVSVTEPEADDAHEDQEQDDPDDFDGELANELMAAAWYDTGASGTFFETEERETNRDEPTEGDNVRQAFENGERLIAKGTLRNVLSLFNQGIGFPLDADPRTDPDGDPPQGPDADPAVARTLSGDAESSPFLVCTTIGGNPKCAHFGFANALKLDEGEDLDAGEYDTPAGTVTIEEYDLSAGTVKVSTDFGIAAVITKGGPNARVCRADGDGDGTPNEDGDALGLDEVSFRTPANPNSGKPYGLSHVQVCYDPDSDGGGGIGEPDDVGDRECFPASKTAYIGFAWWLPIDTGNAIQSDEVAFDLGFYAEQCRHNDGSGLAPEPTPTPTRTPEPDTD